MTIWTPGQLVEEEMVAHGWTRKEMGKRMGGINESCVSHIIVGRYGIGPKTAERLERAFGIPARFWLILQRQYNKENR